MKARIQLALKAGVSIGLLWWILHGLDFTAVFSQLARVSWWQFALPLLVVLAIAVAHGVRWHYVIHALGDGMKKREAVKIVLASMFFNQALPSTIGGDVIRVGYASRIGIPWKKALAGVALDRIAGLFALVLWSAVGLLGLWQLSGGDELFYSAAFVVLLGVGGTVTLLILNFLPQQIRTIPLLSAVVALSNWGWKLIGIRDAFFRIFFISLAVQLAFVLMFAFLGYSLGVELGMVEIFAIYPVALLVSNVPISIAGWGVREGAMVAGLSVVGVAAEVAVATSLLYGLVMLMVGLIGGLLWALTRTGENNTVEAPS